MCFSTSIINIEGKHSFFGHFWYQTFIVLVLVICILTLDMSVNNTSNSSIFHILHFHNLAKKLMFNGAKVARDRLLVLEIPLKMSTVKYVI